MPSLSLGAEFVVVPDLLGAHFISCVISLLVFRISGVPILSVFGAVGRHFISWLLLGAHFVVGPEILGADFVSWVLSLLLFRIS